MQIEKKKHLRNIALSTNWNSLKNKSYKRKRGNPQKSGICRYIGKTSPVKPNSARRSIGKFSINGGTQVVKAYIPGEKHSVVEYSVVLLQGGGAQDLPGVRYSVVIKGKPKK